MGLEAVFFRHAMPFLQESFGCCCSSSTGEVEVVKVDTHSEFSGSPSGDIGAAALRAKVISLGQEDYEVSPRYEINEQVPQQSPLGEQCRIISVAGLSMSEAELKREKTRLQAMVKDFARKAIVGIAVSLVNPDDIRRRVPYLFCMDRRLSTFWLTPKDDSTVVPSVPSQTISVRDLRSVFRGTNIAGTINGRDGIANFCIGLAGGLEDLRLFFHFEEPAERDKFYTCLMILRCSAEKHKV